MFQKECGLSRASIARMGGGGGGSDINQMPGGFRSWKKEEPDIHSGYQFQRNELGDFRGTDPFLSIAGPQAIDWFQNRLPQMLGQFPGFGQELQQDQSRLQNLYGQQGKLGAQLGAQATRLNNYLLSPNVAGTIHSGGALTPGLARDVAQQTRGIASAQGGARSSGALGQELLNRDAYRQQRFNTALQQGQGLLGQAQGVRTAQAGITGMQQSNLGQQAGLTGQRANLLGQEQALQSGGLQQLVGTGQAGVSQFGQLTNPILGYLSSLFGGNQQAAIAQAGINAQSQASGDAAAKGTAGSAIGAVGSIVGMAL